MARHHRLLGRLASLAALLLLPAAAGAQALDTFNVGLLGGVGGAGDSGSPRYFGNPSYQLNLSYSTDPSTQVGLRLGHLGLDKREPFGSLRKAGLSYATLAGEYKLNEGYYESGVFLGLGAYRLTGRQPESTTQRETAIGACLGLTGELKLRRWLGVLVEISGHYADLKEAKVFGLAQGGLALHF